MIARTTDTVEATPWRRELARAVRDPAQLLELLELDPALVPDARRAARLFPLRVPRPFVARMRRGDAHDPLLRQVLPLGAETVPVPGFHADPLREAGTQAVPGVLHKYHGRALLIITGACAVHCRYCFRRHFPYQDARPAPGWSRVLEYLDADTTITEVILSGGDPLSLRDETLAALAQDLGRIPHLKRLRVHSRLPVVLPQRVDDRLCRWLGAGPLQPVLVTHCNHPQELDTQVREAVGRLSAAGVSLLNQSVLLRGVNDRSEVLVDLSERLFEFGVLPYYLHALDPVHGAAHFAVPDLAARTLHAEMAARLPGYLLPRLVREVPGDPAKRDLTADCGPA